MFGDELRVLGDVACVEIGDAEVEQYVEDVGEVEDGKIEAVGTVADGILYTHLDTENPHRFDDDVGQQEPEKSRKKFLLHGLFVDFKLWNDDTVWFLFPVGVQLQGRAVSLYRCDSPFFFHLPFFTKRECLIEEDYLFGLTL